MTLAGTCLCKRVTRLCATLTCRAVANVEGSPCLQRATLSLSRTDLASARAFYEATLGLPVVDENAYACVFDAHGTMVRITAVAEVAHRGYTVLGWRVTGISETVAHLESLGVVFARYDGMA